MFISYSRADLEVAKALELSLTSSGLMVFIDQMMKPGEIWDNLIEDALKWSEAVIVLWSSASAQSSFVRNEARWALKNSRILPILIGDCDIPIEFLHVNYFDLRSRLQTQEKLDFAVFSDFIEKIRSQSFTSVLSVNNENENAVLPPKANTANLETKLNIELARRFALGIGAPKNQELADFYMATAERTASLFDSSMMWGPLLSSQYESTLRETARSRLFEISKQTANSSAALLAKYFLENDIAD